MDEIKKTYRVKSEHDFQKVFHQGKSVANKQIVLYSFYKDQQTHFRVGLSVGKKIGNAVKRNQVKRYFRQALLELKSQIRNDVDILLIARPDIKDKDFSQVKSSMIHVMKLANILISDNGGNYEHSEENK